VHQTTATHRPAKLRRIIPGLLLTFVAGYLLLLIPDSEPAPPSGAGKSPFFWNRDVIWKQLESQYVEARGNNCDSLAQSIKDRIAEAEDLIGELRGASRAPDAGEFDRLETTLFELAPRVAACPERLVDYAALVTQARSVTKLQSEHWNFDDVGSRQRLYRILFGTRIALEEVMLQIPTNRTLPELLPADLELSATPSFQSHGLTLHSGDILVSRGGAPTSALIARGNDYPGSFSHVALLHVNEKSGDASVIESHIECGVTVRSFEEYLQDKKLRLLVLRLRSDLVATKVDPLLAHQAANTALVNARQHHVPYDFAMDYRDPQKQFCSEVVSTAYASQGIRLWLGPTFISSPVVSAWLASLGVRYFETQEPADLEYDPQLRVVAEWRDLNTLFKAHVDDVVTDAMLAAGRPGESLPYQKWQLPFARLSKAYSVVLNWFGRTGPIPEGMSATQALRVDKFRSDHAALADRVLLAAEQFRKTKGYTPPYWELIRLAREALNSLQKPT
jgi:hypothetical protein